MNDLDLSYEQTKASGSSFRYSFFFLPREKRDAMTALYAFCRAVDDVVDEDRPPEEKRAMLDAWKGWVADCYEGREPCEPLARALIAPIKRFKLPRRHFEEIIEGCRMDVTKHRYETFTELDRYCYHVSSAVGLLSIEIFEYEDPATREYAVALGKALQLTNILRDVGEDYAGGRVYLPAEELRRFGVSSDEFAGGKMSENLRRLLRFQAARARSYYEAAEAVLPPVDRKAMLAARIMAAIYAGVLNRIIEKDYDVFQGKISVPKPRQLLTAIRVFSGALLE